MATALQAQLAQINRSSTKQLDLKAQRAQHSKSLLFDPRDAANQTFDTIFHICAEGFQELCMLDPRFLPFAQSLFSEQTKSEDRGQMTAQENQELDKVIARFLALVSGRLLLRPALKAVEWLVRRFRVHEYNLEPLILSFLPYHANPVFPTLLAILPAALPPTFNFLHPYMASRACPPRHALLYAAINNPSFFTALNSHTLAAAAQGYHSAPALGFWASLTAQAINGQLDSAQSGRADVRRQREEDLLLRLVPLLQQALRIKNVPELFLASCMIVTILVTKAQLQDKLLDALMDAVVRNATPQTFDDALTCLAVIAEERRALALPPAVTRALLKNSSLQGHLSNLSGSHQISRLYTGLALAAIEHTSTQGQDDCLDLIEGSLSTGLLTSHQRAAVVSSLLSATSDILESNGLESTARLYTSITQSPQALLDIRHEAGKLGLALESLEMQLQLPLASDATIDSTDTADVEMLEVPAQAEAQSLEHIYATLPPKVDRNYSFLTSAGPSIFTPTVQALFELLRRKHGVVDLLQQPMFTSSPIQEPAQLSFLARLWTSRHPAAIRLAALQSAANVLKPISNTALDLQALLPYMLIALTDSVEAIRRNAASLLILVASLYRPSQDKGKVAESTKIWAHQHIYADRSKSVHWLSGQDAYKILSTAVLPSLEECVLDQGSILRVIKNALNGASETAGAHAPAVGPELKSSLRAALFSFLCSHATATSMLNVRIQLLTMITSTGKSGSTGRAQFLVPSLRSWATTDPETREAECAVFGLSKSEVDSAYIGCLSGRSTEELNCLRDLASGELGQEKQLSTLAVRRIKQLWSSMKLATQQPIAAFLLTLALNSQSGDHAESRQAEALETLRQVSLPTEILSSFLDSIPSIAQMEDQPPATKRRRTSRSELAKAQIIDPLTLNAVIYKLTVVLELVEGSRPEKHPELLKGLFHILGELQHYRTQIGSSLVYLQQLVLGCLLSIVESLEHNPTTKVDRSILRADLIVECVRSSTSAQVHNSALLLIASLASWAPDLVLHSVMPIFTFMTNTILRQGDDYSAHIIDQTISRVVPPLAASLRKKNKDLLTGSAELLLSFTAAFEHIPLHRRLRLFSHLVTALGPRESLAAIVAMLFERYPSDRRVPVFVSDLMSSFSAQDQLVAALRYLDLVQDALKPKRTISELVFIFSEKSADQVEQSIINLLESLAKLLGSRSLQVQIMRGLDKGGNDAETLHTEYALLLETVMSVSQTLKTQPRFHAASEEVLAATLALLPTAHYIMSAKALLERQEQDLRLLVLQSLEIRSKDAKTADLAACAALLDVLSSITAIVREDVNIKVKHSAVTCIDTITEKFGKKQASVALAAAEAVASECAFASSNDELRIVSLLCLATMIEVLKDDMLPLLPGVLTRSFEYLETSSAEAGAERLHEAVYALLGSILEHLPWMFYEKTLQRALQLSQKSAGSGATGRRCANSRDQFYSLAAKQLGAKDLLSALDATFDNALTFGYQSSSESLRMLNKVITNQSKATLIKQAPTLFSVLTKTFDIRRQMSLQMEVTSDSELSSLEQQQNALTLDAVMKLNDAVFRPFFVRLVQWATEGLPKKDSKGRLLRLTGFYGFLARFFEALKSVVTSYSSYLLEQAAEILTNVKPVNEEERELLSRLLETLTCSFRHDQDDFWQAPAHFEAMAKPLLSQLSHAKEPSVRDSLRIVPAITGLAGAAASPEHHKALNAALLKLMRHEDALVRLSAVKCEQNLTEQLGEDWLALLPEMLPFISELQEDDDEVVERETLAWIRQIEGILGESLEGMLQ